MERGLFLSIDRATKIINATIPKIIPNPWVIPLAISSLKVYKLLKEDFFKSFLVSGNISTPYFVENCNLW